MARRDPGDDPGAALAIRNSLRDMPDEVRAIPLWRETMERVVKVCGDKPMEGHSSPPPFGRTLRDLARDKAALSITCRECRHGAVLYPISLAEKFGANFPVDRIAPLLRCTECDRKGAAAIHEATR